MTKKKKKKTSSIVLLQTTNTPLLAAPGPRCGHLHPRPHPKTRRHKHNPPHKHNPTQTPRQSSNEKRHKKMTDIANNLKPEAVTFAWMFIGIHVRKSSVAETLRTGFNLKPSLKEVLEIQSEIDRRVQ